MKHIIELDQKCKSCNGTGLYVGMAERDGASVVCHTCKGTGCQHFKHEYEDFDGRADRDDVDHVIQTNVGVVVGKGKGNEFKLSDFGGMPYKDWLAGKPFVAGMEMRRFTCPCWWYQSADYKKKPDWKECLDALGYSFSRCPHYKTKDQCWERWDREFGLSGAI